MLDLLSRNIRFTVTISLSLAASLLLIATIIFTKQNDLLNVIGLSISTSGLATSFVQIIEQLTERIEKVSNQRRFLRLFGCDDKKNGDGSIAIIIPAFVLNQNNSQPASNTLKQQAQKLVWKFSSNAAIKNDVTAASYLVSTFSKLGLPVPQIKWDKEIKLNDDDGIRTYILIGLSNNVIEFVNQSAERYFSIDQNLDNNKNLSEILIKCGFFDNSERLVDETRWIPNLVSLDSQTSLPKNDVDYALFAKFRIKSKIFIICGGGTEWGTRDIGIHMSGIGWRSVYSDLKKEKGTHITANEAFAVVFQIPINKQPSESISVVHKCIRRKK
jgi:hypothetical protein